MPCLSQIIPFIVPVLQIYLQILQSNVFLGKRSLLNLPHTSKSFYNHLYENETIPEKNYVCLSFWLTYYLKSITVIIPEEMISWDVKTAKYDILVSKYNTVTMDRQQINVFGIVSIGLFTSPKKKK